MQYTIFSITIKPWLKKFYVLLISTYIIYPAELQKAAYIESLPQKKCWKDCIPYDFSAQVRVSQ